jgi:hypothetical protein
MYKILSEYYRADLNPRVVSHNGGSGEENGFFRFGRDLLCYGQCALGVSPTVEEASHFDASEASRVADAKIYLPFDISQVIDDLRREHYVQQMNDGQLGFLNRPVVRKAYYLVREQLPVRVRRHFQIAYLRQWRSLQFPHWPVDCTVDSLHEISLRMAMQAADLHRVPFIWFWPYGVSNALILTHDVEAVSGRDFCSRLMDIDLSHGFKASFQVIPEHRYQVPDSYVNEIHERGFEFNIHDLNHDGHLFEKRSEFLRRAQKINEYGRKYGARGFRSGAMYRNQDWYDALEFSYDMSVPNVAHLEPQRGGCCTVMPYFIGNTLELPLTTSQDYSVFNILNEYSIDLWKQQIRLLQQRNGLLSFIVHPDYLIAPRCRGVYETLLAYLRKIVDQGTVWETLPGDVDRWWRARAEMRLVPDGKGYRVEGPSSERARVAYASLDGDRMTYTIDGGSGTPR